MSATNSRLNPPSTSAEPSSSEESIWDQSCLPSPKKVLLTNSHSSFIDKNKF